MGHDIKCSTWCVRWLRSFGQGTKCDALSYQCLLKVLRYEVQVPNVRIANAQVDKKINNLGNKNPQVGNLLETEYTSK